MAKRVQLLRYTTAGADAIIPLEGELVVDTQRKDIRVGDGSTTGGNRIPNLAAIAAAYQPLDSDLTAIAALATATFGRSLLTAADIAALLTTTGLGGPVLVDTQTASNSASLDFTTGITSAYSLYMMLFQDLVPASQSNILLRYSVNGGSTFIASDYHANLNFIDAGTSAFANNVGGTTETSITVAGEPGTATAEALGGIVLIFNPASAVNYKKALVLTINNRQVGGPALSTRINVGGGSYIGAATAINAFRILAASGNLESGTVRLYGIK